MKSIIYLIAISFAVPTFAQDKAPASDADEKKSYVQMHEQMAKAHQQAADCLKSGRSENDCMKAFRETCRESGGPDQCGAGMMHHRRDKESKRP